MNKNNKNHVIQIAYDIGLIFVSCTLFCALIFKIFFILPYHRAIVSGSMLPAYNYPSDTETTALHVLSRGQVVTFRAFERNVFVPFCKRIIGLPGDIIECKQGILFINGELITKNIDYDKCFVSNKFNDDTRVLHEHVGEAHYLVLHDSVSLSENWLVEVPDNQYFLLGDNRCHSFDSRTAFGFVAREHLQDLAVNQHTSNAIMYYCADNNSIIYNENAQVGKGKKPPYMIALTIIRAYMHELAYSIRGLNYGTTTR